MWQKIKIKIKILTLTSGAFSASASSSSFAGWDRKLDALKSRLLLSSRLRGNTRVIVKGQKRKKAFWPPTIYLRRQIYFRIFSWIYFGLNFSVLWKYARSVICADYRKTKSKPCFISANFLLKQITILNRMEWYEKRPAENKIYASSVRMSSCKGSQTSCWTQIQYRTQ